MINSNYFQDNDDIQLQFNQIIDWDEIVELYEDGFSDAAKFKESGDDRLAYAPSSTEEAVEYYRAILEQHGDFAGRHLAHYAQELDAQGLEFKDGQVTHPEGMVRLYQKFFDAGMVPNGFKREFGGMGLPQVAKALLTELMYRADTSMTIAFTSVNLAGILEKFASREQQEKWIPKLCTEPYSVTMGLSEPDYGSDLPNVRTKAEKIDGQWLITGTKRFQTMACGINGDPGLTLCLARTGDASSGARGLSFFLVEGKHIEITGIEKKLGLKGSATCETAMDKAPAELIGEEGAGLVKYVMGMLNGARMSVAAQGCGISSAAYYEAKKYAESRIQFGVPLIEIPVVARMLRRMEVEIAAMRCLMLEGARTVDHYAWKADRMMNSGVDERTVKKDPQIRHWDKVASIITPLSKYYNAEMCNSLVYDSLQVFGGSGFIEEYDVARLYRDARITVLYDGTSQIQVNAAIGGITAGMSEKGIFRSYMNELFAQAGASGQLKELWKTFEQIIEAYKNLPTRTLRDAMSFEVVESATRILNGALLEKTANRLESHAKELRLELAFEYNAMSKAVVDGNLTKIKLSGGRKVASAV